MTTQPRNDRPPSEPSYPSADPPSGPAPAVDWPDRSHFSEFDAAIEAQLAASEEGPASGGQDDPERD
jgi:hypothetical protein